MKLENWKESETKRKLEVKLNQKIQASGINENIAAVLKEQIAPSKRIRSYLLKLLCPETLLPENDFYHLGVAFELFHKSTLIFDDVIDEDSDRDGRVSLHTKYKGKIRGAGIADHMGILLLAIAEKEIWKYKNKSVAEDFNEMKIQMLEGQLVDVLEIPKPENLNWTEWLLEHSYKKTSLFIDFPFKIYEKITGKKIKNIGKNLGRIYQIADDLADVFTGYPEGTISLDFPICYILDSQKVSENDKNSIKKLMNQKILNKESAKELTQITRKYKTQILKSARKIMENYQQEIGCCQELETEKVSEILKLCEIVFDQAYWEYEMV